jgi:hypothetical protein
MTKVYSQGRDWEVDDHVAYKSGYGDTRMRGRITDIHTHNLCDVNWINQGTQAEFFKHLKCVKEET